MPPYVLINLDTAAREVILGAVVRPSPGLIEVPYVTSPDTQEFNATAELVPAGAVTTTFDDEQIVVEGFSEDALLITLTVTAADDVGNESITQEEYIVSMAGGKLRGKLAVRRGVR